MKTIKINNVNIWGVKESAIASGYPFNSSKNLNLNLVEKDINRLKKLFKTPPGSGHDCAAKGITIQFDLTAPEYFWRQLDRYHFIDHVSSQSKMHCIKHFEIKEMCNEEVDQVVIDNLQKLIAEDATLRKILSNTPSGFCLTSRMTTNLLQLKNILNQRRHHKLEEWQEFCNWIELIFEKIEF